MNDLRIAMLAALALYEETHPHIKRKSINEALDYINEYIAYTGPAHVEIMLYSVLVDNKDLDFDGEEFEIT